MGRLYKIVPTIAQIAAAADDEIVLFQAADDRPYHIRSIVITQEGNNDNEGWSATLREITGGAGGDAVAAADIVPVDGSDSAFGGTITSENGTDITNTSLDGQLSRMGAHLQGAIQMVPTEAGGSLGRVAQGRDLVLQLSAPPTNPVTPIVVITVEEI